jgi:hypothetical protein
VILRREGGRGEREREKEKKIRGSISIIRYYNRNKKSLHVMLLPNQMV